MGCPLSSMTEVEQISIINKGPMNVTRKGRKLVEESDLMLCRSISVSPYTLLNEALERPRLRSQIASAFLPSDLSSIEGHFKIFRVSSRNNLEEPFVTQQSPAIEDMKILMKKGIKSPMKEEMKSPMKEELKSPMEEEMKGPMKEEIQSPMKEEIKSPTKIEIKSPMKEEMKSLMKEEMKCPTKIEIKSPMKEEIKSPMKEEMKSLMKEEMKCPIREGIKSPMKEEMKSLMKEDMKCPIRDEMKSPIREEVLGEDKVDTFSEPGDSISISRRQSASIEISMEENEIVGTPFSADWTNGPPESAELYENGETELHQAFSNALHQSVSTRQEVSPGADEGDKDLDRSQHKGGNEIEDRVAFCIAEKSLRCAEIVSDIHEINAQDNDAGVAEGSSGQASNEGEMASKTAAYSLAASSAGLVRHKMAVYEEVLDLEDGLSGRSKNENDSTGTSKNEDDSPGRSKKNENYSTGRSKDEDDSTGRSKNEDDSTGKSKNEDDFAGRSKHEDEATGTSKNENYSTGTSKNEDDFTGRSKHEDEATGTSKNENYSTGTSKNEDEPSRRLKNEEGGSFGNSSRSRPTKSKNIGFIIKGKHSDKIDPNSSNTTHCQNEPLECCNANERNNKSLENHEYLETANKDPRSIDYLESNASYVKQEVLINEVNQTVKLLETFEKEHFPKNTENVNCDTVHYVSRPFSTTFSKSEDVSRDGTAFSKTDQGGLQTEDSHLLIVKEAFVNLIQLENQETGMIISDDVILANFEVQNDHGNDGTTTQTGSLPDDNLPSILDSQEFEKTDTSDDSEYSPREFVRGVRTIDRETFEKIQNCESTWISTQASQNQQNPDFSDLDEFPALSMNKETYSVRTSKYGYGDKI